MGKLPKLLFILIVLISCQRAFNQAMLTDPFIVDKLFAISSNPNPKSYEGSPYLLDSFIQGKVTLSSDASFSLPIRYNLFTDVVDVIYRSREMEIRPVDLIKKIEIADHQLILTYYPGQNKDVRGFLFLLDSGKWSLLHKRFMVFEEWQPTKALESGPTPAKFRVDHDEFFIRSERGNLSKIKTVKEIPLLLGDKKSKIEAFIKENKIKLKPDHLTRLFQFYNSL